MHIAYQSGCFYWIGTQLPHHFVQFSSLSRAESYEGLLQLHIKGNWSQSVLLFCTTLSLKQRAHTADVHYVHYVHSFKLKLNSSMCHTILRFSDLHSLFPTLRNKASDSENENAYLYLLLSCCTYYITIAV